MDKYDCLRLENQLCFPLYACAKEVTRRYTPLLSRLDLTYTQYIAMMILWEDGEISCRDLGRRLFLDSGTLTPLLKKLEARGYVTRCRSSEDERVLMVSLTDAGAALRDRALEIPPAMGACVPLTPQEAGTLYQLLYKILGGLDHGSSEDHKQQL